MPPVGFELAIVATERPQTLALDRSAKGIPSGHKTETLASEATSSETMMVTDVS
jgi:hypothetical protein